MQLAQELFDKLSSFEPKQILNEISINNIAQYFQGYQHEEGLTHIDPEMLQIIYQKISGIKQLKEQNKNSSSIFTKNDVLQEKVQNLLSWCRSKGLINIYEYMFTIKNKNYKPHSYYGRKLVQYFPDEFQIGTKCTHYHCKTMARKIQQEYGIFRPIQQQNEQNSQKLQKDESDLNFIVSSQDQQIFLNRQSQQEQNLSLNQRYQPSSQQLEIQPKNKIQKQKQQKTNQLIQSEQMLFVPPKKRKYKDILNSQSQQNNIINGDDSSQEIVLKRKRNNHKNKQLGKKTDNQQKQIILRQILDKLKQEQILEHLGYQVLFEYLFEKSPDLLINCLDIQQVYITVKINKKNNKKHKKLQKTSINVKSISLQEIIEHAKRLKLQMEGDPSEYNQEDHVKLGRELVTRFPKRFSMQGEFIGYDDEAINKLFEEQYNKELAVDKDQNEDSLQYNPEEIQSQLN